MTHYLYLRYRYPPRDEAIADKHRRNDDNICFLIFHFLLPHPSIVHRGLRLAKTIELFLQKLPLNPDVRSSGIDQNLCTQPSIGTKRVQRVRKKAVKDIHWLRSPSRRSIESLIRDPARHRPIGQNGRSRHRIEQI